MTAICPYCSFDLSIAPKRKTKCPNCGKLIFVRNKKLVTETEAEMQQVLPHVVELGITREMIEHEIARNSSLNVNDAIQEILEQQLTETTSRSRQSIIYDRLARIADWQGKGSKIYKLQSVLLDLLEMKSRGVKKVYSNPCNDEFVCRACRKISKLKIDIDEAIQTIPTVNNCTSDGGCRCVILEVPNF